MKARFLVTLILALPFCLAETPEPKQPKKAKKVFVDPAEADKEADFKVQGEYTGKIGENNFGAHLISQGGGKFQVVVYPGGLPGNGWNDDRKNRVKTSAETKESETSFLTPKWKASIKDGVMTVSDAGGNALGELKHVARKSPTLGKKPPEGAVILFDGSNVDQWKSGQMVDGKLLKEGATSKQRFGDFVLHLEFRLPYKPFARSQNRGNSGCYILGLYECQILDSFGLEGTNNECGAIYRFKTPDVNMCFPPLSWQTYDIDFTAAKFDQAGNKTSNAKITVRHNDMLIHKDLELPSGTGAARRRKETSTGPIHLQAHSNPVRFQNIWLVKK